MHQYTVQLKNVADLLDFFLKGVGMGYRRKSQFG